MVNYLRPPYEYIPGLQVGNIDPSVVGTVVQPSAVSLQVLEPSCVIAQVYRVRAADTQVILLDWTQRNPEVQKHGHYSTTRMHR